MKPALLRSPWCLLVLVESLLVGCSAYSPQSLAVGSSLAQTVQRMGSPTGEYALAAGAKRLEFARGPAGLHTYMVDFDASGRLVSWEQVLSVESFGAVGRGTPREEVLKTLGHPGKEFGVWSGQQTIWAYSFDSPYCQWFLVGLGSDGQVSSTSFGPDPRCEAGNGGDRN